MTTTIRRVWNFLHDFAWPFGICGGAYAIALPYIPASSFIYSRAAVGIAVFFVAALMTLISYMVRERPVASVLAPIRIEQVRDAGRLMLIQSTNALGVDMGAYLYYK